jgi:ligand-binding sensor domain-containing protein
MTGPDVIVNDVLVDPKNSNHVLMATDRAGVLASEDGGSSFQASNTGFSARQVTSFAYDPQRPSRVYVGVVNDKDSGGVFMSPDGGVSWQQQSHGLNGRDVFSLAALRDGTLLAGTNHGIFRLENGEWMASGSLPAAVAPVPVAPVAVPKPKPKPGGAARRKTVASGAKLKKTAFVLQSKARPRAKVAPKTKGAQHGAVAVPPANPAVVDTAVWSLATVDDAVYAGTADGLLRGSGDGRTWVPVADFPMKEGRYLGADKNTVFVANLRQMAVSTDGAAHWRTLALPSQLMQVTSVTVDEVGNLWCGGPQGVFYSGDHGTTWQMLRNLYLTYVSGVYFDPLEHRILATSFNTTLVFAAHVPDFKVTWWDSGWNLHFARTAGDHLLGVTMYDGTVVQPRMVESKMNGEQ